MIIMAAALITTNMAWILFMYYILKKLDTGVRR